MDDCELPPREHLREQLDAALDVVRAPARTRAKYETLPVSWLLSRSSGSLRSKDGAPKCRPPGETRPIVRNGESCQPVLVLPKRGWLAFLLRVLRGREEAIGHHAVPVGHDKARPGLQRGSAVGSIVIGSDGAHASSAARSRDCPCTVWLAIGVP